MVGSAAVSILLAIGGAGADDHELGNDGRFEPVIASPATEGIFRGTECAQPLDCPDEPLTRWVMAVWLVRALGESPSGSLAPFPALSSSAWWQPYVESLAELGISQGCEASATLFCPHEVVTRGLMATYMVRAFDLFPGSGAGFVDTAGHSRASDIDALAAAYIATPCSIGPARFCPDEPVTRGEMATALARTLGLAPLAGSETSQPQDRFRSIGAGTAHSCGLLADGAAKCWDNHDNAQVTAPPGPFASVSTGPHFSCGFPSDGPVVCWGSSERQHARVRDESVASVSIGRYHSCGLRAGGSAKCWGYNFAGQSWAPGGVFSDVSVGDYHSCGLRSDGSVTCWGRNEQGQSVDPTGGFAAVAAGGSHSCGLRSDGSATCWGRNDHGQSDAPSGVFAAIAAGGNNSCGLRATGAVVCWGDSGNGRLDVPTGRFTAVSVGHVSICGLRSDGRDSCWGNAERDVHRPRLPLGLDKPSDRPITSYFGPRMNPVLDHFVNHDGIDFGALRGEPVLAAGDGVVAFAGHWTGYGETVIVDHGGGVTTIYAHLASIQVSEGDEVLGGDRVGIVGCSGYCTVPHLHFEVRTVGIPVDPEPYLTGAPAGGPDR